MSSLDTLLIFIVGLTRFFFSGRANIFRCAISIMVPQCGFDIFFVFACAGLRTGVQSPADLVSAVDRHHIQYAS